MRPLLSLVASLLLAGCANSAASTPTPTPQTTAQLRQYGARFTKAPAMTIRRNERYTATMITTDGTFTIQLLPRAAPLAANNFVFLARHHYYDNNLFFRIVNGPNGAMIQTGDPTGTGFGGPGYAFNDEKVTMAYTPGIVAMANSGKNTNGSQFFIVGGHHRVDLPPAYTIFGKVISGLKVVQKIAITPVTESPSGELSQPLTKVVLQRVIIHVAK